MSVISNKTNTGRSGEKSMGWLLPLLLIVLSAGLVLYFLKGSNTGVVGILPIDDSIASNINEIISDPATVTSQRSLPLIDGTEINVEKGSIEDQLFTYITSNDPADSISKKRWFDFDNLNFNTNSAEITDESMMQVKNIAAILKAYPKVKIKIGGYTDKTGNENANLELSQKRAIEVAEALKLLITNAEQITGAEGYGSSFAKFPSNAPDADKQKDRRISINVKAK